MKKKVFGLIVLSIMIFGITGCGNKENDKLIKYLEENNFKYD